MAFSAGDRVAKLKLILTFLMKDMMRDGLRTTITIINLTAFLCCYFCLAALARAAREYGNQDADRSSLMVVQNNVFDPSDSIVTEEQFAPIRELMPGLISAVSPVIFRLVKIDNLLLQLRAAALEDFQPVFRLELASGDWPKEDSEVIIGNGTATMTGWKVGRQIWIYGREFTISGIVNAPGTKSSSVWMDLDNAEKLFGTSGIYQFLWLNLTPGVNADEVVSILQDDPRMGDRYQVYFVDHLYQQYTNALNDVAGNSNILVFLALITIMIGSYGTVYLTLAERARELTILRAVGYSTRTIRSILSARTLVQVIFAFLCSWLFSTLILLYLSGKYPIIAHSILLDVRINPVIFFGGLFLSLLFGWIGALLPMLRVTHSNVRSMMER